MKPFTSLCAFCCVVLALLCLPYAGAAADTPADAPAASETGVQDPSNTQAASGAQTDADTSADTPADSGTSVQNPSNPQDASGDQADADTQTQGQDSQDTPGASPAQDTGLSPNALHTPYASDSPNSPDAQNQQDAPDTPDAPDAQTGSRSTEGGNISQQVSACMDLSKTDGSSMDALKQELLQQLRQSAVDVLFGKVYYQQPTGLDTQNYAAGYAKQVAEQLEFQTEPEFYNGKQFGELCARAWVSMPARQVPTISPRMVQLDNFCYQADPGQSRETLRKLATTAAVDRVLENIAPGTLVPLQYRQQIQDGATINGDIRKLDETTYCLSISVNVIPLQVNLLPDKDKADKQAPEITEPKPGFTLDLKAFQQGDLTPDYGKNVAVFQDIEGKSLGSNVRQGTTAEIKLSSHNNYKALVYVKKDISYDFLHSEELLLFTLHYKNKKYEPYSFKLTITDANQPLAYFRSWSYSTDVFPWANAANYNEYRVEKKDGLIVFFYNGKFMYNFPSEGDELVQIKVPLRWNDRLYNVLIYDEAPNPGDTQP